MWDKFKSLLADDTFFYGTLIVLIAVASFGLGRVSVVQETPQKKAKIELQGQKASGVEGIEQKTTNTVSKSVEAGADSATEESAKPNSEQTYVGSKNGTKYHLLHCPGAKQIKEENKIYFGTKEEAQKAGYTPASNCKGI